MHKREQKNDRKISVVFLQKGLDKPKENVYNQVRFKNENHY